MKFHTARVALFALIFGCVLPAQAVVVQEVSITPYQVVGIHVNGFYTGNVLAGINQLLVDGTPMNGFCIDPYHFSLPTSDGYSFAPLAGAPKAPGTMNALQASQISRLWAMAFSTSMTAPQAAGFQIAIWEIVAGANFSITSGNDFGASTLLANLASFSGQGASLVALTGPGQDYVVPNPNPGRTTDVPDNGTTIALLGFATIGMVLVHRRPHFAVA